MLRKRFFWCGLAVVVAVVLVGLVFEARIIVGGIRGRIVRR